MRYFILPILLVITHFCNAQSGCTDPAATNYNSSATTNDGSCVYPVTHNAPLLKGALASDISESSGLVWTDGKLWTHNDSGNPSEIYSIDTSDGHTLQTVVIDNFPNTDWEDITADANYIYIGNFGNNSGDRRDLSILKVKKSDITAGTTVHVNAEAIAFSYTDQTSFVPSSTHNFDCESVFALGDSLYIFTKDRGDMETRVYCLPKTPGTYAVSPYTRYNVGGLITGADYDSVHHEVMLIGYLSGHTNPFLWVLSDFTGTMYFSGNKRRIEIGGTEEWQTEGICYLPGRRFFVSCESAGTIDASLFVSNESWMHTLYTPVLASEGAVSCYPNPADGVLTIAGINTDIFYKVFDVEGRVVIEGKLSAASNSIEVKRLKTGNYFLETTDQNHVRRTLSFSRK